MSFELRFQVPGQLPRSLPMDQNRMLVGTLLSNHVVLRAPGVDPIHGLFEEVSGAWFVTDVGSETGIKVNGVLIDVEAKVSVGDKVTFGSVVVEVAEHVEVVPPPPLLQTPFAKEDVAPPARPVGTVVTPTPSAKPHTPTVRSEPSHATSKFSERRAEKKTFVLASRR